MYQKQIDAIFCEERYGVVEASTKSGKTVGCIIWILEQAMKGLDGQNYWWVAPVYPQAEIAYRRIKTYLPKWVYEHNDSKLFVRLPNGAMIWFKSAEKPDSLYGEDVYACVIDEATRVREESWWAVRSTITATQAPVRIIGNVKGRKNWAYRLARRAEQGDPDHHYAKITAYDAADAGVLDYAEIEDAKRQLPDGIFKELYLAEPGTDEGNPFGIEAIRACTIPTDDMSTDRPIAWGWDLAKSADYSVGIALDKFGDTCRFHRFRSDWEFTVDAVKRHTKRIFAFVDSTGVGDPIVERLRREGGRNFRGYKISSGNKQQLMERLAVAIQQSEIRFPEGPISAELESFEYEYTRTGVRYTAPDGLHDDCVVALALAVAAKAANSRNIGSVLLPTLRQTSYWRGSL
jgi:phage FluMu gp28-like protein